MDWATGIWTADLLVLSASYGLLSFKQVTLPFCPLDNALAVGRSAVYNQENC